MSKTILKDTKYFDTELEPFVKKYIGEFDTLMNLFVQVNGCVNVNKTLSNSNGRIQYYSPNLLFFFWLQHLCKQDVEDKTTYKGF